MSEPIRTRPIYPLGQRADDRLSSALIDDVSAAIGRAGWPPVTTETDQRRLRDAIGLFVWFGGAAR